MTKHQVPRDETGASAVEYGLLVSLLAAVIVVVVAALGMDVLGLFQSVCAPPSPFTC